MVGVPLAIVLGFSMVWGMVGINIGAGVGSVVAASSLISRFLSKSSETSIRRLVAEVQQEQVEVKVAEEDENIETNLLTKTKSSFFRSYGSNNIDSINAAIPAEIFFLGNFKKLLRIRMRREQLFA